MVTQFELRMKESVLDVAWNALRGSKNIKALLSYSIAFNWKLLSQFHLFEQWMVSIDTQLRLHCPYPLTTITTLAKEDNYDELDNRTADRIRFHIPSSSNYLLFNVRIIYLWMRQGVVNRDDGCPLFIIVVIRRRTATITGIFNRETKTK